jgi:uncharacterized protein (TIGR02594 family)
MSTEVEKYRVTTVSLNIRAGASTKEKIIGSLKKKAIIEKIEDSADGTWIKFIADGVEGWVSKKFLHKVEHIPLPEPGEDFPWMPVAEKEKGTQEVPGPGANPKIVKDYFSATNLKPKDDVTAWCAAFANWSLQQVGFKGTGKATAASFLGWGEEIDQPVKGCIVVFKREGGNHVGFYIGETEKNIILLGGNQENEQGIFEVSEKEYAKADLLGYRLPTQKDKLENP